LASRISHLDAALDHHSVAAISREDQHELHVKPLRTGDRLNHVDAKLAWSACTCGQCRLPVTGRADGKSRGTAETRKAVSWSGLVIYNEHFRFGRVQ
jgi:hypothetical protein